MPHMVSYSQAQYTQACTQPGTQTRGQRVEGRHLDVVLCAQSAIRLDVYEAGVRANKRRE
jgi:hypothetical protein